MYTSGADTYTSSVYESAHFAVTLANTGIINLFFPPQHTSPKKCIS